MNMAVLPRAQSVSPPGVMPFFLAVATICGHSQAMSMLDRTPIPKMIPLMSFRWMA